MGNINVNEERRVARDRTRTHLYRLRRAIYPALQPYFEKNLFPQVISVIIIKGSSINYASLLAQCVDVPTPFTSHCNIFEVAVSLIVLT